MDADVDPDHHVRSARLAEDARLDFVSIAIGINQTILMCLSTVVIASLIGARGLGEDVLDSLQ